MKRLLITAAILLAGCGGTYDTQCDGPNGIDCSLVGLPICTKIYGDGAPHAFCTQSCSTSDDCGPGGICSDWHFPTGRYPVCITPEWADARASLLR